MPPSIPQLHDDVSQLVQIEAGPPIHPITLTFRDPALEAEHWARFYQEHKAYFRTGFVLNLAIQATYGLVEWFSFPPDIIEPLFLCRYGLLLPGLLLTTPLFFSRRLEPFMARHNQGLSAALVTFTFGVFALMALPLLPVVTPQLLLYSALIQVLSALFVFLAMRLRFIYAAALGALSFALELGVILAFVETDAFSLSCVAAFGVGSNVIGMIGSYALERLGRQQLLSLKALERERQRAETLLLNVLPAEIAERLKRRPGALADAFEDVTVLFVDLVGFTQLSAKLPPDALVRILNRIFSTFDTLTEAHGAEKIKTIGDAYMAAAGIPQPDPDHAATIARLALAMRAALADLSLELTLEVRIGIHSGPVVAGVIGQRKFTYDLWGDTVNTASRMESHGLPGQIQLSDATRRCLGDRFLVEPRGSVEIKGKGQMETFWLKGEAPSHDPGHPRHDHLPRAPPPRPGRAPRD